MYSVSCKYNKRKEITMRKEICARCGKELNTGLFSAMNYDYVRLDGNRLLCIACRDAMIKEEKEKRWEEEKNKKLAEERLKKEFIVSTTDTLDGFKVIEYLGVVSDSNTSATAIPKIFKAFAVSVALNSEMTEKAVSLGGNALLGVKYVQIGDEMLGYGTAALVEKTEGKSKEEPEAES